MKSSPAAIGILRLTAAPERLASPQCLPLWLGAFTFTLSLLPPPSRVPLYAMALRIPETQIGFIIGFFAVSSMNLIAWTVDLVPAADRGKAMGTYSTVLEPGIAAGAIGAVFVAARAGCPLMFASAAALALAGGVLAARRVGARQ